MPPRRTRISGNASYTRRVTPFALGVLLCISMPLTAVLIWAVLKSAQRVQETGVLYEEAARQLGARPLERGPLAVTYAATIEGLACEFGHRLPRSKWPPSDPLALSGFFVRTRAAAGTRLWAGQADQVGLIQRKWIPWGAEAPTGDALFDHEFKVFTDAP